MATAPDNDPQKQRKQDDKILRTRAIVGTKEQRSAFKERRREIQKERFLSKLTPDQRSALEAREQRKQEAQAAQQKRQQDDKILRTKGVVGDKAKRQQFREDKARVQRERALAKMTPEQRERALANEEAKKRMQQRKADDKILRTTGIVGDKAARELFNSNKARIQRDRALARMTPEQRDKALAAEEAAKKREEAAKEAREAERKKREEDKTRRQVAKVGNKEEREAWRAEKERLAEEDKLKKMTPEEREAYLEKKRQEREAEEKRKAEEEKAEAQRQVAKVGNKEEREKWRRDKAGDRSDKPQSATQTAERESREQPAAPQSVAPVVTRSDTRLTAAAAAQATAEAEDQIQSLQS